MASPDEGRGKGETMAWAAFVFALMGIAPLALGLGFAALRRCPTGGRRGLAWTAVVLGVLEIAGLAVLGAGLLLYDPFPSRERAAIVQLRAIRKAQETFKSRILVDQDRNGVGEYGLLPELARGRPLPAAEEGTPGETGGGLISAVLGRTEPLGYAEKYGYYFLIYLPKTSWGEVVKGQGGVRERRPHYAKAQETAWIAYAWPAVDGGTARGVLVADRTGIYRADNSKARFSGEVKIPKADSALTGPRIGARVPKKGRPSTAGETWDKVE
ncbi:MAG: hypothetical protein ACYTHM_24380 [Planctomycetota bacterium]|jgi:hypothetical protein